MADKKKWKKILYENQGVPDNYVDETFLDEMRKNVYTREYEYWNVVKESGTLTQQASSVCIFVVIFIYMDNNSIKPEILFIVSSILTLIGYIVYHVISHNNGIAQGNSRTWWDDFKTCVIFIGFGFGLSPVLMTLTDTISTDTIYAMTAFMLIANVIFHDYSATAPVVSGALSLNAAIFASVCLASRLHTTWHAFATVSFAVEIFALWPEFRRKLKKNVQYSQVTMTITLGVATSVSIATVSLTGAVIFSLLHIFVTFICPAWLISLQPYKNNIYGPWDEAVIEK
ncbi:unnamed protein product [Owenia fusiformis]|uniref:Uncharacterized protein n=1 Tax=Owenia fusiformis TaxID=6347 RepID=A0A8J1U021_OWEFU|nr:unnamed protein product [Owenia fusiformis]